MAHRGFAAIGLHQPKNHLNIGEVMRAAGCYDVGLVAICGRRFGRSSTDTQDAWRHLPVLQTENLLNVTPFGAVPIAVEFIPSATPLQDFVHPERAYYLLGPEDGSLPSALVERCAHVVYIPIPRHRAWSRTLRRSRKSLTPSCPTCQQRRAAKPSHPLPTRSPRARRRWTTSVKTWWQN